MVHVHGHGSKEELKMMLSMIKPRFFVPVHGEYRHLVAHAAIAQSTGIPLSDIFVLEDGDVLELSKDAGEVVDEIKSGLVYIRGQRRLDSNSEIFDERKRLARDGVVVIVASRSQVADGVTLKPEIISKGFLNGDESATLLKRASEEAQFVLEETASIGLDWAQSRDLIKDRVSKFLYEQGRVRPTILVHLRER